MLGTVLRTCTRQVLDFALPPRCAGCGTIVSDVHSFCGSCWNEVQFLGAGGCGVCGIPLEATEADTCGRCMAAPPLIARTRAAGYAGPLLVGEDLTVIEIGKSVKVTRTGERGPA